MPLWLQVLFPVASVATTALLTWYLAQRRIAIENVTQERAKWRANIRRTALDAHDAMVAGQPIKVERVRNELSTWLNPYEEEDWKLLACVGVGGPRGRADIGDEFALRVALLLKHDWERAKWEASSLGWLRPKPKRKETVAAGKLTTVCPNGPSAALPAELDGHET